MELTFEDATEADHDALEALNRAAYRDVVTRQFGEWDEALEARLFAEKWAEQRFRIVAREGLKVAALWVVDGGDHLWLREIQVYPVHQSRGVGTALVTRLQAEAAERCIPVRLQVLKMSRAIELYRRLHFTMTGASTDSHYCMEWRESGGRAEISATAPAAGQPDGRDDA